MAVTEEGKTKVVRSKDVMNAISDALEPISRQKLPVSEVFFVISRALVAVPEFYADDLRPIKN